MATKYSEAYYHSHIHTSPYMAHSPSLKGSTITSQALYFLNSKLLMFYKITPFFVLKHVCFHSAYNTN